MLNGNEVRTVMATIGLAEKGYKYTSKLLSMYKSNSKEFGVVSSITHDVLDVFSDSLLTGVWDVGEWNYEVVNDEVWEQAPWHVNGQLFVYYKDPKSPIDTWKASLLLNYVFNRPYFRRLPNLIRPKHLKDFTALFSVEITRSEQPECFLAISTLKYKHPKTDDHIYTGQVELELKNNSLSGVFYNVNKIREPKDKTARAHVSFHNKSRWSSFAVPS